MKRTARNYHRRVWLILGLILPLVAAGALFIKQSPLGDRPAVQLEAPGDE